MGCNHSKTTETAENPAVAAPPLSAVNEEPTSAPASTNQEIVAAEVAVEPEANDEAPASVKEAPDVPEATEEPAEAEVEPEEQPVVEEAEEKPEPAGALVFVAGAVAFNEKGVAFYNFDATSPTDPNKEVHVSKRFSEFKTLHAELAKLMASEKNVSAADQDKFETYPALPALPKAGVVTFLRGRSNPKLVEEREAQFVKILNAVARHPVAFQSEAFTEFLA